MDPKKINPFFNELDLSTPAGMKLFKAGTVGLEDNQKYDRFGDSIMKHLEQGRR